MPVYSEDRTKRLLIVLGIVAAIAGGLLLVGLIAIATEDADSRGPWIFASVLAAVMSASVAASLTLVRKRHPSARRAAVVTGVVVIVCGVMLVGTWLAFLLPLVGLGLLFLALVADEPVEVRDTRGLKGRRR